MAFSLLLVTMVCGEVRDSVFVRDHHWKLESCCNRVWMRWEGLFVFRIVYLLDTMHVLHSYRDV